MKKLFLLLFTFILIFLCSCSAEKAPQGEKMYFIAPVNRVRVDGRWQRLPLEVCLYSGGESYIPVFTFPDTKDYVYAVYGDMLYYTQREKPENVTGVDLSSVESENCAALEADTVSQLLADESGVYAVTTTKNQAGSTRYELFTLSRGEAEQISQSISPSLMGKHMTSDGINLYYLENDGDGSVLRRYSPSSGECSDITRAEHGGALDYSPGYVYIQGDNRYRVNIRTGELEFVRRGSGNMIHGGWLYYWDRAFCESSEEYEIMRRSMESGTIESCGKADLPNLEFSTLAASIWFGRDGFVIIDSDHRGGVEYVYFRFGEAAPLRLMRGA